MLSCHQSYELASILRNKGKTFDWFYEHVKDSIFSQWQTKNDRFEDLNFDFVVMNNDNGTSRLEHFTNSTKTV